MTRVAISKDVLSWALNRLDDPSAVERKFPKLSEWRRGESQPTMRQLEDLARATFVPFGYFFLATPPQEALPIPHFRTSTDKHVKEPSPNLLETVSTMKLRQEWMHEYLVNKGQDPLDFVGSARVGQDAKLVAQDIRQALSLEQTWASKLPTWTAALTELRKKIEEAGIIVSSNGVVGNNTHRKLDPAEFRGFVLVDKYAPLIFVNASDSKAAQMFTFAHELAHVWLGRSAAFDLRDLEPANDETEQTCNLIAAEFLVPDAELRAYWKTIDNADDHFNAIARHFKVSELVAARRALDIALITKKQFIEFYRDYQESERRAAVLDPKGGGDFYKNQNQRIGKRFAQAVVRAVREGSLLYLEAYQLTGLHGKTFEQYVNTLENIV